MSFYNAYIDMDDALKRIGGNEDFYKKLLERFSSGNHLEELENAIAVNDMYEASRVAHKIKGVAANLSLTRLNVLSKELELIIENGLDHTSKLDEFRDAYGMTMQVISLTTDKVTSN